MIISNDHQRFAYLHVAGFCPTWTGMLCWWFVFNPFQPFYFILNVLKKKICFTVN